MDNDKLTKNSLSITLNKNRIKQSVLCCIYCGKSYKTKLVLDKHLVLCEVSHKSKTQINNDDEIVLPSQKQLYQIILELSLKCNRLESKVADLSKYINRKIDKVDIIDYLNSNIVLKPSILFDNITETINIEQSDIEYLFHNSFKDTFNTIISKTIYNKSKENQETISIAAFTEKAGTIYIYTTQSKDNNDKNTSHSSWIVAPKEKIIRFLNIIQLKMSKALSEWRKQNIQLLNESDSKSILYDKTFSKLIGVEFKKDEIYNKFYNSIYHKIKQQLNVTIN
jgi:hypothetical protein